MNVTYEDIQRFVEPQFRELIAPLLDPGLDKETLEQRIALILGHAVTSAQVDVARMNMIGGLRAAGYVVTGGRGGGKTYRIVGWQAKPELIDASQWTGRARDVLDWYNTYPLVTLGFASEITYSMSRLPRSHEAHENCFPYLWCYEMARDEGRLTESPLGGKAVILKKFSTSPRFRIFNLNLTSRDLLALAENLAQASLGSVTILNCTDTLIDELKSIDPKGSILVRNEAIYNCKEILTRPQDFFGHQGFKAVKRNQRDTQLFQVVDRLRTDVQNHALMSVVNTWREHLESRHRQLAITRDYRAFGGGFDGMTFLGLRSSDGEFEDNLPVAAYCLSSLANRPDMAADIAHKGLNYSSMIGGRSGTSDWALYEVCAKLFEVGVEFIQAGAFEGGGVGLPAYKGKFTDHVFASKTFQTSFKPLDKSVITVNNAQRHEEDNVSRVEIE